VAKARKMKLAIQKGKGKETVKEEQASDSVNATLAEAVEQASSATEAPPTPPKEAAEDPEVKQEERTSNERSSSPSGIQDVADLVSRFANFIAPLPIASPTANGGPPSNVYNPGIDLIKRAGVYLASPPNLTPPTPSVPSVWEDSLCKLADLKERTLNQATAAVPEPCAYTHPATWDNDYISGWRKHASAYLPQSDGNSSTFNYKPYVPPVRRDTSPPATNNKPQSPADKAMKDALASAQRAKLLAGKLKREAILKAQKAKFDADTIAKLDALASYPFAGKVNPPRPAPRTAQADVLDHEEKNTHSFNSVECSQAKAQQASEPSQRSSANPTLSSSSSSSSNVETAYKYASLKSSFDKFVNDFNANLADAFGGPAPEILPTLPHKTASATGGEQDQGKKEGTEDVGVSEAKGEKETPSVQSNKKANSGFASHNATCDVCEKWIVGIRYKCFTCPDW